jgi:tRNA pseudouridine38-40 synthase
VSAVVTRTFKLTIAYDGTAYAGWQVQPGRPTIQGLLEDAIEQLVGQPIRVVGSGRTDAGVHALGQVASCQLSRWNASAGELAKAINTKIPDTIVVTDSVEAPDGFHAIRDAVAKRYRYQIQIGGRRDAFDYRYHWHVRYPICLQRMERAAQRIVGRHDFASFQATGSKRKTTTRNVTECRWIRSSDGPGGTIPNDRELVALEIEADGFLYNMVRSIVGTLVEIGRGKYPDHRIDQLLAGNDRTMAGPTAPAKGLFLKNVTYCPA